MGQSDGAEGRNVPGATPATSPWPPARGSRRTRAAQLPSRARSRPAEKFSTPRSASPTRDRALLPHTRRQSRRGPAPARRRNSLQRSYSSRKSIAPFRAPAFPQANSGATTMAELEPGNAVTVAYARADMGAVDSTYAWLRLLVALVLGTIGSVGMWSYVVALPPVQADFGVLRADASLPYTMGMIGFAFGGVALGRLSDHYGVVVPAILGTVLLSLGYFAAGYSPNIWVLAASYALAGVGTSGTFGPIVSDMSHWFKKRRGIAIGIASCGNYAAGAIWPPIIQYFIEGHGWRATHIGVGFFCLVTMVPLALKIGSATRRERV